MKFGIFPLDDSCGVVLAHAIRGPSLLKKGHVLTRSDIDVLRAYGTYTIVGARLEEKDVGEDDAAAQIGAALSSQYIHALVARAGRANLIAQAAGLVVIDRQAIEWANSIDEAITIATVPQLAAVKTGQIAATIKIIPFAVSSGALKSVVSGLARQSIRLAPFVRKKIALISTRSTDFCAIGSADRIVRARIADVGGTVSYSASVAHRASAVAVEIRGAMRSGADIILVHGASSTCDRGDVIPAGIATAGGAIDHLGIPVHPGNLLALGHVESIPILMLPESMRSSGLNGFDWILQRLVAGIPATRRDIAAMGVGGLLIDAP